MTFVNIVFQTKHSVAELKRYIFAILVLALEFSTQYVDGKSVLHIRSAEDTSTVGNETERMEGHIELNKIKLEVRNVVREMKQFVDHLNSSGELVLCGAGEETQCDRLVALFPSYTPEHAISVENITSSVGLFHGNLLRYIKLWEVAEDWIRKDGYNPDLAEHFNRLLSNGLVTHQNNLEAVEDWLDRYGEQSPEELKNKTDEIFKGISEHDAVTAVPPAGDIPCCNIQLVHHFHQYLRSFYCDPYWQDTTSVTSSICD